MNTYLSLAERYRSELIRLRRDLHRIPEIGSDLPKTQSYIIQTLEKMQIPYRTLPGLCAVIAEVNGTGKPPVESSQTDPKILLYRADMDALSVTEPKTKEYHSLHEGCMHACGHDVHMAVALIAARMLFERRDQFCGTVRFIFQPAEEIGQGALALQETGILDDGNAALALHVGNLAGDDLPCGSFVILPGAASANMERLIFTVHGKGSHGSYPSRGVDPIHLACLLVLGLDALSSREVPSGTPFVLTFGSIQGGDTFNAIPETVTLMANLRTQDESVRRFVMDRIQQICDGLASAYRARIEIQQLIGGPAVHNDPKLAVLFANTLSETLGPGEVLTSVPHPLMASDDFTYYAQKMPGVYFFLNTNNPQKGLTASNHNMHFDVDEEVLWKAPAAVTAMAESYFKDSFR